MHPVESYLTSLHASLGAGTPETSGYPALSNLLNAIGDTLKPKITAVIHPANNGAGIPDGGLFSSKEMKKTRRQPQLVWQRGTGALTVRQLEITHLNTL